jgi:hypothetical protein
MTLPAFTIDLGNGLHLDSTGALTGAIDGKAAFALSAPLPIPGAALQQAFSGLKTVIPKLDDIAKDIGLLDQFKSIGLSADIISTFGKVAQIAETLASVIPIVNIAAGLLSVLGSFGGSDPIHDLITQEFTRLFARLDEIRTRELAQYAADNVAKFLTAKNLMDDYQTVISNKYSKPGEREQKLHDLELVSRDVGTALVGIMEPRNWDVPFHPVDYSNFWPYLTKDGELFTVPTPGTLTLAVIPGEGSEPFDHRPMVQLVVYGIQTYLTLIKAVVPEYRTTSLYKGTLRDLATGLSKLMDRMRADTLARTVFKTGVPEFRPGPRQFYILSVGAMDLRTDTDDYLNLVQAQTAAGFPLQWNRYGNLNTTWSPPPSVDIRGPEMPVGLEAWATISPAAVELANQQSERDYALLLTRSGYFTLAHLEALLRHLSTEPDTSETVTAKAEVWRKPMAASAVTVSSTIPLSPSIEAAASREPQQCEAYLFVTTQPLLNEETVGYRLRWMTLPNGRTETLFDDYVWNEYVRETSSAPPPDGDVERNWKLQVNENPGMPLDPIGPNDQAAPNHRLFMDSLNRAQEVRQQGTVQLTANTFDWYVAAPDDPIKVSRLSAAGMTALQGVHAVHPRPLPSSPAWIVSENVQRELDSLVSHGGLTAVGLQPGDQTWKGDRREWRTAQIEITYDLYWKEDQLSISLKARPQDRNYVIYLVVEELLARSNQWLRTPLRIEIPGQLTYVPQSFFDAEAKARKHANDVIGHIERNYVISRQPGPSDPVTNWLRPGTLNSVEAMQEFLQLAQQHAPELVAQAVAQAGRGNAPG